MSSACPAVSVVIPLYNKAPYIKRAIDSVLSQTIQDFEIVVIDDGSNDGGDKIVEGYVDSRLCLIHQSNQGVSAARNHGIDVAKSELIAFLDADDEWMPDFLETIFRLRNIWPNAGIYGTGFRLINSNDANVRIITTEDSEDTLIDNYFSYLCRYGHIIVCASSVMIPKEICYNFGGFDSNLKWGEDRDLYSRIALFYPIAYSPDISVNIYTMTENNSNSVISHMDSKFVERVILRGNCIVMNAHYLDILDYVDRLNIMIAGNYLSRTGSRKTALKYMVLVSNKFRLRWIILFMHILFPEKVWELICGILKISPLYEIILSKM